MEVGNQSVDDSVLIAGGYHKLCGTVESVGVMVFHPLKYAPVGNDMVDALGIKLVGIPLADMHVVEIRIGIELDTKPIETLEGSHGSGAHSYQWLALMGDEVP